MTYETVITLSLAEASEELLRAKLSDARVMALRCEQQGSYLHTWTARADAIRDELERRRSAK